MKNNLMIFSLFLAFGLILSACANTAQDAEQIATQVAAQVAQALSNLEATQKAQPTSKPFVPTVEPMNNPTVSQPGEPCNPPPLALGESYPDGTSIYINTPFNKSWTIQNVGSCTWNANYKIKFISGNAMSGPESQSFGASVTPGGSITLTLPLKAPGKVGTATGYWGLYDDKNNNFGRVWVAINSVTGSPINSGFSVTSVTTKVDKAVGKCGSTFNFLAYITANGAGTVTYYWTRSDSSNSPTHTLIFGAAGTQTVVYDWGPNSNGTHWVKVYIETPNRQYFSPVNFNCWWYD